MKKSIVGLLLVGSMSAVLANAFEEGSTNLGVTIGTGTASYGRSTDYYTILGVSGGVFIIDGLNVGLGYRAWFGASPSINEVILPVTYYIPLEKARPYLGTFYQHTFVEDREDYDSYGYRLGVAMDTSRNSYASIGFVQEFYSTGGDNIYPEIVVGFSF